MEHLDKMADEKRKLLFALQSQATPNVICITLNQYQDQKDLMDWFKTAFSAQQHFFLDLTAEKVESLFPKLLAFSLDNKENIKPLDLVHVIGLENSVSHFVENHAVDLPLIANMNYDRENFFKRLPFHTVLWGNAYFFKQLHRNAPDFMHWVTLKFDFSRPIEHLENIQPLINQSPKQLGKIPERNQVIKDLEAQYANLNLDASDTKRLFKDKLTLLEALGSEHYKQQEYAIAKDYLEKALSFAEKINNPEDVARVRFQLGDVFLGLNLLDKSLLHYTLAKDYCEKFNINNLGACYHQLGWVYLKRGFWKEAIENYHQAITCYEKTGNHAEIGGSYHQIGMVYHEQGLRQEALDHYNQAIAWYKKTENLFEIGGSFHQIARVYEDQGLWHEALENYHKAITWNKKTGNHFAIGGSFHQIGMVYQRQKLWQEALHHYHEAVAWNKKTGNHFDIGHSYHQMGRVCEEQSLWEEAIEHYHQAIDWFERTGNHFELGGSFHQIGRAYEKQNSYDQAQKNYQLAIENFEVNKHPDLKKAEESLQRVNKLLAAKKQA